MIVRGGLLACVRILCCRVFKNAFWSGRLSPAFTFNKFRGHGFSFHHCSCAIFSTEYIYARAKRTGLLYTCIAQGQRSRCIYMYIYYYYYYYNVRPYAVLFEPTRVVRFVRYRLLLLCLYYISPFLCARQISRLTRTNGSSLLRTVTEHDDTVYPRPAVKATEKKVEGRVEFRSLYIPAGFGVDASLQIKLYHLCREVNGVLKKKSIGMIYPSRFPRLPLPALTLTQLRVNSIATVVFLCAVSGIIVVLLPFRGLLLAFYGKNVQRQIFIFLGFFVVLKTIFFRIKFVIYCYAIAFENHSSHAFWRFCKNY